MKHSVFHVLKGGVLASSVLICAAANAADPQVEALLAKMRSTYKATKTATFTTESHVNGQVMTISFAFISPTKIRADITVPRKGGKPVKAVEVTDGKTIHLSVPGQTSGGDKAYTPDSFTGPLGVNLESICFFDYERQLSTAPGKNMATSTFKLQTNQDWDGKKWTVLQETAPKEKVVCSYYVDPKTLYIWRTVVKAMPGGPKNAEMDCRIMKMSPNAKVDPGSFGIVKI